MAAYQDTCRECGRVYDTSMGHVKRYLQEGYCSEGCKRRAQGGSSSSGGGGGGGSGLWTSLSFGQKALLVLLTLAAILFSFVFDVLPFDINVIAIGVYALVMIIIVKAKSGIGIITTILMVAVCTGIGLFLYVWLVGPILEELPFMETLQGIFD